MTGVIGTLYQYYRYIILPLIDLLISLSLVYLYYYQGILDRQILDSDIDRYKMKNLGLSKSTIQSNGSRLRSRSFDFAI